MSRPPRRAPRGAELTLVSGPHEFHIPVMGTGFTIDTPLRVARLGISSVVSLVDDELIERVRRRHARAEGLDATPIRTAERDARARRITAYLDLMETVVRRQIEEIRALSLEPGNDKARYFDLLPTTHPHRHLAARALAMSPGPAREALDRDLSAQVVPGAIGVNVMTKLDRARPDVDGEPSSDARAAVRGFARSRVRGYLVLSAGINQALFGYMERFDDFHRDGSGSPRKGVVLKVSDHRSALVQGRVLARRGIPVEEFRVESGLNCGGHTFATDGDLLGPILHEFKDKRAGFDGVFEPAIRAWHAARGTEYFDRREPIRVTVQGGIGTYGETQRLRGDYGVDATGWGSPFLLVPEVTALDDETRGLLARSTPADLYTSGVSPLGIGFNNLRGSSSER